MPGSPVTNTMRPAPSRPASTASRTRPSSRSRPTILPAPRPIVRARDGAPVTPVTSYAVTGAPFPFRSSDCGGPHVNCGTIAERVGSPTRTQPGEACDCRRAATFTASPRAEYSTRSPAPIAPVTTGPLFTPTRTSTPAIPHARSTSTANVSMSSTMRSAARTARS